MEPIVEFMRHHATLVLFACICSGYLIGAIPFGKVRLGGVCGTLLMALLLGQADVEVAPGASQVAFALFIFSLGYLAGPQFVASFRRQDLRLTVFPAIEIVVVTGLVLAATSLLHLGPGAAAGLFAGGTSQSAALGTASESLDHLGLSPAALAVEQTDLASAYSLCYLCGLITIVVFSTQIAPAVMRTDLAAEAGAVARQFGATDGGEDELPDLVGRVYRAGDTAPVSVSALEARLGDGVRVGAVIRQGEVIQRQRAFALVSTDLVQLVGRRRDLSRLGGVLGAEHPVPAELAGATTTEDLMVTRRSLARANGRLQELLDGRGDVSVVAVTRAGRRVPVSAVAELRSGDVLTMFGSADSLQQAGRDGKIIDRSVRADWAYLGAGLVVGILIGLLDLQWGPLNMTIGTGGGVLLAGLLFGWFRMRRSTIGAYEPVAAEVIKDIGLTIFIGVTGLTGAPRVASMVREFGLTLPLAAVAVSLIPATISLLVARRLLRLPSPLALGAVIGQQCSTPALTVLQERAGNDTPTMTFVKVYAMSNVVLPLLAPFIVAATAALR